MFKGLSLLSLILLTAGCGDTYREDSDKLTLAYLNAKVFAESGTAVDCQGKKISERLFIGCKSVSLNGNSKVHLYFVSDSKFYAVNGTARQTVENHFSNDGNILLADLPLPADINISEVLSSFE